ncbi:unnamed protein product [Auanema sp. JU1783]|nr:unnamed protein product [Auanema sp. JU1783]
MRREAFLVLLVCISLVSVLKADDTPYGRCIDSMFNNANSDFNTALNISTDITWRNSKSLDRAVLKIIQTGGIDGLNSVCNARQAFSQSLGFTYPFCIDRYYLLSLGNTDFVNTVYYVHLFKHLEFVCSADYEVYLYENTCITGGEMAPGYEACRATFTNSLQNDYNNLCPNVQILMNCIQTFFKSIRICSTFAAWSECEKERVGFAYDCPNLVCNV